MKFSVHSKFRFCTRFMGYKLKDENAYKKLVQNDNKLEEEIVNEMDELFNSSELVYVGKLGTSDRESHYYVDINNMATFVVEPKANVVVTCYKIFYDLSYKLDKDMAKSILKEINTYKSKKEKQFNKIKNQIDKIDGTITSVKLEIERVTDILKNLEEKSKLLEKEKELKENDILETEYTISKLATKLCYSCQLLNDVAVR